MDQTLLIQLLSGVIAFSVGIIVLFFQGKFKDIDRRFKSIDEKNETNDKNSRNTELQLIKLSEKVDNIGKFLMNGRWRSRDQKNDSHS